MAKSADLLAKAVKNGLTADQIIGIGHKSLVSSQFAAGPKFKTFLQYAKVELIPPTPGEFGEVAKGFAKFTKAAATAKWRHVTVKEALLNTCVAAEVALWFFAGEIIGRRSFLGYRRVPGAMRQAHVF